MKRKKHRTSRRKWLSIATATLLALGSMIPAAAAAPGETFTVTYKTNAGVTMGTVTYNVDDTNDFPQPKQFGGLFSNFVNRAVQKGGLYLTSQPWYNDAAFTQAATFPTGQAGAAYTVYCRFTTGVAFDGMYAEQVEKSYASVFTANGPHLGGGHSATNSRDDQYEQTRLVFEKKQGDSWQTVPDSYYRSPYDKNQWNNVIWMRDVKDSGTYRLKYVKYTAVDNDGNELFYDIAYGPAGETYTVNVLPAPLEISGVQAENRPYDGTDKVTLTGGQLTGVLSDDDVSFTLPQGVMDDASAGGQKAVTTHIELTGAQAGNYTLTQPALTVDIAKAIAATPQGPEDSAGARPGQNHGVAWSLRAGMEYRLKGQSEWTPVTQDMALTALAPGVYEIRTQGDENHEPSAILTVDVPAAPAADQQQTPEKADGQVKTGDGGQTALWALLLAVSLGGAQGAIRHKRALKNRAL